MLAPGNILVSLKAVLMNWVMAVRTFMTICISPSMAVANETGEQGVAGKTSEIENDEGKGAYLGCQGNTEKAPYCADDVAVG